MTPEAKAALLPCPFPHDDEKLSIITPPDSKPYVLCEICFSAGPLGNTPEHAVQLFNSRPSAPVADWRGIVPVKYAVGGLKPYGDYEAVIEFNGVDAWAIRRRSECLSRSGKWVHEPMPSNRTEDFLSEHRFKTLQEAVEHLPKGKDNG